MSFDFRQVWMKERALGLARLAGSRVSGRVPVRQALVDELLRRWRRPPSVEDVSVRLADENLLHISARLRVFGLRKRVDAAVKIAPAVQLQGRPTLHLSFVEPTLLATVASFVAPLLTSGVSVTRDGIAVDLSAVVAHAHGDELLPHLRAVAIDGKDGVIWLNVDVEVTPLLAPRPEATPTKPQRGNPPPSVGDAVSLFAGLDLEVQLRVTDSLANDILETFFIQMPHSGAEPVPDVGHIVRRAVGTPRVRFEPGAMVLETHLRV